MLSQIIQIKNTLNQLIYDKFNSEADTSKVHRTIW